LVGVEALEFGVYEPKVVAAPLLLVELGGALDGGLARVIIRVAEKHGDVVGLVWFVEEVLGSWAAADADQDFADDPETEVLWYVGVLGAAKSGREHV
jgi:hypothetical protein